MVAQLEVISRKTKIQPAGVKISMHGRVVGP